MSACAMYSKAAPSSASKTQGRIHIAQYGYALVFLVYYVINTLLRLSPIHD